MVRELETLHKEHEEILRFLTAWEGALAQAASEEFEICRRGLEQVQRMTGQIAEICEHCRREEEYSDSPLLLVEEAARSRLRDEHAQLHRANYEFRRELEFTTASFTGDLCRQGRHMLSTLRRHIAYEEGLLKQLEAEHLHN
jgi:hypothetical protein